MKLAIITMAYGENYGNRLQNYAMQELLRGVGVCPETIHHVLEPTPSFSRKTIRFAKTCVKILIRYDYERRCREKRFRAFDRKHIQWGDVSFAYGAAPDGLADKYDYFIVGSDQVWR